MATPKASLTQLQPYLIPLTDVLQVTGDEIVESPHEAALLLRRVARGIIGAPRRFGFGADTQRMLEHQFSHKRLYADSCPGLDILSEQRMQEGSMSGCRTCMNKKR